MKVLRRLRDYPIPLFAFCGLLIGAVLWLVDLTEWAHWVWFSVMIGGGLPIVYRTARGMLKGEFATDIVAMLAIVTAVLLDQVFAGAVVVLMQSGGEAIEAFGLKRATSSLQSLLERAPRIANRKVDGRFEEVKVEKVKVGDVLLVRPGDFVPVDGIILTGEAEIDESALTGEPLSKNRKAGDRVLSGSINVDGSIEMRAERIGQESQYAKIVRLVKEAQEEKAPIQRLADKYAIFFTPLALIMAGLGFWITQEPWVILAVLVVATPCPLILATPLAVICGINRAADEGIIVKGGAPMEQVASAKAVLFDKTGTITFGTPYVEKVIPFNDIEEKTLLLSAGAIEEHSSHSIAQAIVRHAKEKGEILPPAQKTIEIPGRGMEGEVEGQLYCIGSPHFLAAKIGNEKLQAAQHLLNPYYEQDKVLILVARDNELVGCLVLSDKIRPSVPALIERLRALGVQEVVMLTGDSRKNAEVIARQAGIGKFKAELLPEQKVECVHKITEQYDSVIMVGDGINDAPALATATVGIAMGKYGTAISAEAADIVLLVDDLSKVADSIEIGQRMLTVAKQSIFIGMGLSFVLMSIAAFGVIPPPLGAMLQEIIDVAVILNALRAR